MSKQNIAGKLVESRVIDPFEEAMEEIYGGARHPGCRS